MSDARSAIFSKIAAARARKPSGDTKDPKARLASPEPALVPAVGSTSGETREQQFGAKAMELGCSVATIGTMADVPQAVAAYLIEKELPKSVLLPDDADLTGLEWQAADLAAAQSTDRQTLDGGAAVTRARAGIAETGALAVTSGSDYPVSLGLLPDTHIVVLKLDEIVAGYEGAWPLIRGSGNLAAPRGLTFIGGPSRTADIEATLVMGAHGPRAMHIIIVRD